MHAIEPLERRRLFTTGRFLDSDTLTIEANAGDDVILLETVSVPNHLAVHVNAEPVLTFPFTSKRPGHDIFRIVLRAGGGTDRVGLQEAHAVQRRLQRGLRRQRAERRRAEVSEGEGGHP